MKRGESLEYPFLIIIWIVGESLKRIQGSDVVYFNIINISIFFFKFNLRTRSGNKERLSEIFGIEEVNLIITIIIIISKSKCTMTFEKLTNEITCTTRNFSQKFFMICMKNVRVYVITFSDE